MEPASTATAAATSQQLMIHLARYNARANKELYDILGALTGRARRRDVGAWFGSVHGILNHILISDIQWLRRYRALTPESPVLKDPRLDPPGLSWDRDLHENFQDLRVHRGEVDLLIPAWFETFPAARFGDVFTYRDSAGIDRSAVAGSAFEFLFLHQTHHRGQISQILDTFGLPNNLADNAAYLDI